MNATLTLDIQDLLQLGRETLLRVDGREPIISSATPSFGNHQNSRGTQTLPANIPAE